MKPIVKYTTFNDSESFEKWQTDNPNIQLTQIIPFMAGLNGDMSCEASINMNSYMAVCVLYYEIPEQNSGR